MGVFKLETIRPDSDGSMTISGIRSELLEKERTAGYAQGFKDGVNVTRNALDEEANRTFMVIKEALQDAELTKEQAAASIFRSLAPLLEIVFETLTPRVLETGLLDQLEDKLKAIFRDGTGDDVQVEVSPEKVEIVQERLFAQGLKLSVKPNPSLTLDQVDVRWSEGIDRIDISSAKDQIFELVEQFISSNHEELDDSERKSG